MVSLPEFARPTVVVLRDGFRSTFDDDLDALYVYGALTFPESEGFGDLDYHAFLAKPPSTQQRRRLVELETLLRHEHAPLGADLDGWLIATGDAGGRAAPQHLLRPDRYDGSWGLHRAHWLAGRVVVLTGPDPAALVSAPGWDELAEGLRGEWEFLLRSQHDAFAILNACRILWSQTTRDVVVSKFASAAWALAELPPVWHLGIHAALATYRGARPDSAIESRDGFVEYVGSRLPATSELE